MVQKVKKTIQGLVEVIKNPWLLNKVINDDLVWQQQIAKTYKIPNGLPVIDLSQLGNPFSETLENFAFLDGGSLPTDIALLKHLARKYQHCKYFEIGTWRGESVVNVAEVAQQCYTLNLSKPDLLARGLSEKYADLQAFFSKNKKNITHLYGDSMHFDFEGLHQKFDLIFIDGNHHYEYVKNDTQKVFEHLVHDQSIVVWHDYAYTPEKYRPEVLAGILAGTPENRRTNLYHVSNTMCAIYSPHQFAAEPLDAPIIPNKTFKVTIETKTL